MHAVHTYSQLLYIVSTVIHCMLYCSTILIQVSKLREPSKCRMIRSIDDNFLEVLKDKLEADPSAPGVPPIAVLCQGIQVSLLQTVLYLFKLTAAMYMHTCTHCLTCTFCMNANYEA